MGETSGTTAAGTEGSGELSSSEDEGNGGGEGTTGEDSNSEDDTWSCPEDDSTATDGEATGGSESSDGDPGDDFVLLRELTKAICEWGASCCERGELAYLVGPYFDDSEGCTERLWEFLVTSNGWTVGEDERKMMGLGHRFPGLAFDLAHRIQLHRSDTLSDGLRACIQAWRSDSCRAPASARVETCDEAAISRACQLDKLFIGTLDESAFCNWELRGPHTDIECAPGLSCESADGASANDPQRYRCIRKGLEGDACMAPEWHDDTMETGRGNGGCEWGLYCDRHCGTCRQRPGIGERCAYRHPRFPRVDQMTVPCQHDLYCDPKTERCVDECSEGYGCGPRTAVGQLRRGQGPEVMRDDRMIQFPTPDHASPQDVEDRCASGLSCTPYRSHPEGGEEGERPGMIGYYFGLGTDHFGTSFECRAPGGVDALCDTKGDCGEGYYCEKAGTPGGRGAPGPHHHQGEGDFAEVGRCTLELQVGASCFKPKDDELDFDLSADQLAERLAQADARCASGHFCDISQERSGRCQPKRAVDEPCYRHAECDQDRGLGLCLVRGNESAMMDKRCVADTIKRDQLCAPRAGLGSNAPFPVVVRGSALDSLDHRSIIVPGHAMLTYEVDARALEPAVNEGPEGYTEFPATHGLESGLFPELWQGPQAPAVQPETGHIFKGPRFVRVGQADVEGESVFLDDDHPGDLADIAVPAGFAGFHSWWGLPSGQPFSANLPINASGVDISGGAYRPYAWMQGQAMVLRSDLREWEETAGVGDVGFAGQNDVAERVELDERSTRSDFRHLASHCDDADATLVCERDPWDDASGNPFRCRVGVPERGKCDSDPGTFGPGRNTCQSGLECYKGRCMPHARTGDLCRRSDTGDDASDRIIRCDWRHRAPIYARIPCPNRDSPTIRCETGRDAGGKLGSWLVDPLDGEFVEYIHAWDNGCENVHASDMCRLINENAHDAAYCDGVD